MCPQNYINYIKSLKQYLEEEKMFGIDDIPQGERDEKLSALSALREKVNKCKKCSLGLARIKSVFGEGSPNSKVMFVGEGPGYAEDREGKPFVGRAGQLLTKIIESIGLNRESVYIANIVKCHPMVNPSNPELHGNDRPPTREESAECLQYLYKQIEIIKPKIVCALGSSAAQTLLNTTEGISKLRGRIHEILPPPWRGQNDIMRILPTYHPAALLRNPSLKKDVWHDMKLLRSELEKQK